jgi:hypothetical protein
MSELIKLRGKSERRKDSGPYPLGEFPDSVAIEIGRHVVHRLAVGHADITGDDFGGIFASAISGQHKGKPLGIADVEWNGCAWTVKTVKDKNPFKQTRIRVISGRNSPAYSSSIKDVFADFQATGKSVLGVWNARVNEALHDHDDLRIFVIIRNMDDLEFTMFEHEAAYLIPGDYDWSLNEQRNFEARNAQGKHCFTWQPHGSQFTMILDVPGSSYRFRIKRPAMIEEKTILNMVRFDESWIQHVTEEKGS